MNTEQVNSFYTDLAALCRRYNMQGVVGVWFHGPSDLYGFINAYSFKDPVTAAVCNGISMKLQGWMDGVSPMQTIGRVPPMDLA